MPEFNLPVGILILNYHEPDATLTCVRRLLEVEGRTAHILWLENDARNTWVDTEARLRASGLPWIPLDPAVDALPGPGRVGVVRNQESLGYAGGNNVGLRFLHRFDVPFAWIMNNDTYLLKGSSADLLRSAQAEPEVGLWGMDIVTGSELPTSIWRMDPRKLVPGAQHGRVRPGEDDMSFISGCAMFVRMAAAAAVADLPEDYYLYYEDTAFSWEMRRKGYRLSIVPGMEIWHEGSLTTGRRSPLTEFYCNRNRWYFIQRYFPQQLFREELRFLIHQQQKLVFRGEFDRLRLAWQAYLDFKAGRLGPTARTF